MCSWDAFDRVPMGALRTLIWDMPDGVVFFDSDYHIMFANAAARTIFQLESGPEREWDVRKYLEPMDVGAGGATGVHSHVFDRNGDTVHVQLTFLNDAEAWIGCAVIMVGSDEMMRTKSELETAWRLTRDMEEILEGSFDGILVTDGEGNVQFVNSAYERVAAIPKRELEGRNMRALINPVWMENSVAFVVLDERRPVSKQQVTQDGRDIIVTGKPVFDQDGNIRRVVINARDITEIFQLREELLKVKQKELNYCQQVIHTQTIDAETVVAVSEKMRKVFSLAEQVGPFDTTVLILGESGVGKEEVARQIHAKSMRRDHTIVTINCGAIPESLLESELFGYEKGAFTGASSSGKIGLLEAADGGSVFLDEIGEIPLSFQVKLLRVLETKQVVRVGSVKPKSIDVRFIAATNRNLTEMVENGAFREDFFYRLNVVSITVPPLRQRREDILPLSLYFLTVFNRKYNQEKVMTPEVIKRLEEHDWQGNVRELRNVIERMVILSANTELKISDVPWIIARCSGKKEDRQQAQSAMAVEEITDLNQAVRELEIKVLQRAKERFGTTREMARHLHLSQPTIVRKLQKYGLDKS